MFYDTQLCLYYRYSMDALDRTIVAILLEDARTPYRQIAARLGVSATTIHHRVQRLKDSGVIRGTRITLDWEAVGLPVTALVSVEYAGPDSLGDVAGELAAVPYIQNCYAVTGEFDLLLTVRARSSDHLGQVLEDIRRIVPGRSRTVVVLATYFEGRIPPIVEAEPDGHG